jgi:hypothetical protein
VVVGGDDLISLVAVQKSLYLTLGVCFKELKRDVSLAKLVLKEDEMEKKEYFFIMLFLSIRKRNHIEISHKPLTR